MMPPLRPIHHSYWLGNRPLQSRFDTLSGEHKTDIVVLGGGITGLSAALELLQRGVRVTVLEAATIGAGTTGGSTGHLDAHPEMGPHQLVKKIGLPAAQQFVALRQAAIAAIEHRANDQCDFVRVPAYYYSETCADNEKVTRDFDAARDVGLDVRWHDAFPFQFGACGYRIECMARMDSLAYVTHLADLVVAAGGIIFENTMAPNVTGDTPHALQTANGSVQFDRVVCAVHCNYTDALRTYLQTPAYQSYVLAARVSNPPPDCLMWDTAHPYFYTRHAHSHDEHLLLIGGCDHRTGAGDSEAAREDLETYLRERYEVQEIVARWSAEFFEPHDGLPIIGQLPGKQNVWIATGLSGVGLTWGTAAGWLIADQIVGRDIPLQAELSPSRFGLGGLGKMISETTTAAADYAERVLPSAKVDPNALELGEGKVGRVGKTHAAVCRTRDDRRYRHCPICVHMGGVVHWNHFEQTWDCPVHGGRYDADGTRIYGPPDSDLRPLDSDGGEP